MPPQPPEISPNAAWAFLVDGSGQATFRDSDIAVHCRNLSVQMRPVTERFVIGLSGRLQKELFPIPNPGQAYRAVLLIQRLRSPSPMRTTFTPVCSVL